MRVFHSKPALWKNRHFASQLDFYVAVFEAVVVVVVVVAVGGVTVVVVVVVAPFV